MNLGSLKIEYYYFRYEIEKKGKLRFTVVAIVTSFKMATYPLLEGISMELYDDQKRIEYPRGESTIQHGSTLHWPNDI